MSYELGATEQASGCLTRLIDIIGRSPSELELLVGFHSGRLADGFTVLLLAQPLAPTDFTFFGYTYFSGGAVGLPDNNPVIDSKRPRVHDLLQLDVGQAGVDKIAADFAKNLPMTGDKRLVKLLPFTPHNDHMGPADQYPASVKGIMQLHLKRDRAKSFFVAAKVVGSNWGLANGETLDVSTTPRYDLPYDQDPRRQLMKYLGDIQPATP